MGKIETLGLAVAMAGIVGAQSADCPAEEVQIQSAKAIIGMSRAEFDAWCLDHGAHAEAAQRWSDEQKSTCAWVDRKSGEVWHAAIHFHSASGQAHQADIGLLGASSDTVLRLIHNEHGGSDGRSVEGFPVWEVDVENQAALLAVADYEEITLVQLKL